MNRAPVVVVAGHVTQDRAPHGPAAGGPALRAARAYRRLGAATRLVTAVGTDFACDDAITVPAEIRRGGATTELTHGPGPRWLARAQPVLAVDLPEAWRRCDLLHLAPVLAEVDLARWAQVAGARMVAITVRGFVRAPGPDGAIARRPLTADPHALAVVAAACVDAAVLADEPALLAQLLATVPVVAIVGDDGAEVLARGARLRVATRGGADAFAAGLFYRLACGLAPDEAARVAAAGAGAAEAPGVAPLRSL